MHVVEKLTINGSADKIWKILSSFDKVETYQSLSTKTELVGQGVGSQRTVTATMPDGNTIKLVEKLDYLNDDEKTMKISIVDGPLPLENAVVTIKVSALEDNKTELEFDSIFDSKPEAEEELKNGFQMVFQDSAQGLEKLVN
jgi:hypothetical protein